MIGEISPELAWEMSLSSIFFPGHLGTHCRQRGNEPRIGINSTERVGVPALRAARVEQEIVKVPQNEAVVALANSQAIIPRRVRS